jgi:hypothetical protein
MWKPFVAFVPSCTRTGANEGNKVKSGSDKTGLGHERDFINVIANEMAGVCM